MIIHIPSHLFSTFWRSRQEYIQPLYYTAPLERERQAHTYTLGERVRRETDTHTHTERKQETKKHTQGRFQKS